MEPTTITFRTTEETKKKLDNIALDENRTMSNLIETIVLKWLQEYEKKQEKNTQKWVLFLWKISNKPRLYRNIITYYVNLIMKLK